MTKTTGARYLAQAVHGYGLTHIFYMPYVMPPAILEMDNLGDLEGALDKAFSANRPVVVDVKSHIDAIAPIAWLP